MNNFNRSKSMKKNETEQWHRRCPMLKKLIDIMKLTSLIFFLALVQVSAKSYSQVTRLNLRFQNETLESVFEKIEANSEFSIFYKNELIKNSHTVSGRFRDALIFEILDEVLASENLTYTVKDKLIIIVPKEPADQQEAELQQQQGISGRVTDKSGVALPGVTVVVKGKTQGTVTDANGNYSLSNVQPDAVLVFSFVGMKMQEVAVSGKSAINITMTEETFGIEEVVAIGYGTVKKSDLTGSVSSVKNEEINAYASSNLVDALKGRAAGVQVMQNDGAPGAAISMRIRGTNSIMGRNEPLYVIDGVPASNRLINNADIESIEILKDASATAIYGSRGANGVVLITTKKGKKGASRVEYQSNFGIQSVVKKIDLMNATQYALLYNEQTTNDGLANHFSDAEIESLGEGFDWQDAIYRQAPIQEHNLSIT
jgi:TonB-dependent SusC/RagA subfamily outer membrane receptor